MGLLFLREGPAVQPRPASVTLWPHPELSPGLTSVLSTMIGPHHPVWLIPPPRFTLPSPPPRSPSPPSMHHPLLLHSSSHTTSHGLFQVHLLVDDTTVSLLLNARSHIPQLPGLPMWAFSDLIKLPPAAFSRGFLRASLTAPSPTAHIQPSGNPTDSAFQI